MRNLHVYILAAVLAAIGLGLFVYKVLVIGLPLHAKERPRRPGRWRAKSASPPMAVR